jgi:hypothetical protein
MPSWNRPVLIVLFGALATLAGANIPAGLDGVSLVPTLTGQPTTRLDYVAEH